MCVMAIGAVVAVAQSVVSFAAAAADYNAREEQWQQNRINAISASHDEQKQITLRMMQEEEALSQKQIDTNIEEAQVLAAAEVSASGANVSGISVANILTSIARDSQRKRVADETNYKMTAAQLSQELKATETRRDNRINSMARPTPPNPLGYALQGIGGALRAAG